jgi:serine/threonine protein kinase
MTTEIFMASGESVVHVTLAPGEYIIGRDEEADICIPDPSVSARHARLLVDRETVCLQDLDSGNGTFIEGEPAVGLANLYDGQSALLGAVTLRVRRGTDPRSLGDGPRYVRGGMVAYGGMGAIHEARQSAMGRKVAMKVMLHSWDESGVKRFLDEARITGMLEHPNIVPVHEMGVDEEDQFFYTMKFVRGSTLAEVIAGLATGNAEAAEKYPLATLLTIFQKVCDAVAFAHSRGVWHRDLKPENIMIGDFGEVLVMDWGLAKESGFAALERSAESAQPTADAAPTRTVDGTVMGTPAYMAPEQARGETAALDHRSDVYALGTILYEILHLQPAVRGETLEEVVQKVATGVIDAPEPRPAVHLPAHKVPASLEAVCRKAMAFEPERRYQEVQDLQADLTAYQSGFATSAESAGLGKHLALFIKRNRGVSLAVSAGFVALLASSVLFTINLVRERNRAEAAQSVAEKNEKDAKDALARALDMEGKARSSDLKAEAALDEKEAMRERYVGIYGSAEKAATESALRSRDLLAAGRFEDALDLIGNAARLMPDKADYLLAKANLLQSSGQLRAATEDYRNILGAGENPQARANLELTEQLIKSQGKDRKLTADNVLLLEKALMDQGRELELVLLNAAATGQLKSRPAVDPDPKAAPAEANTTLDAKLAEYTRQSGWRPERLSRESDGSWSVDLSGLRIKDLSVLRGENIRSLNLSVTETKSLEGLRGLRLDSLDLAGTKVEDLTPVRPMRLESLVLDNTKVRSLDPIRGMPLKRLRAACPDVEDFSPISTLLELEELALPANAIGVDTQPLEKLRTVEHPRFREKGAMPADEFRKVSGEFEESYRQWQGSIAASGAANVPPERIVVREPPLVDLDLRGFDATYLEPLKQVPLRMLRLSSKKELDISPLAGHPTLRHLDLSEAVVGQLAPLLDNEPLQSIVLSRSTRDAAKAAVSPYLKKLGYLADESGAVPRVTLAEFFAPRVLPEGEVARVAQPVVAWRFDDPSRAEAGWMLRGEGAHSRPLAWRADPALENGRGGGFLSVANVPGDLADPYLHAPPEVVEALRDSFGGVLEFDMRASAIARYLYGADLVIEGDDKSVYFFAQVRPDAEWQTFSVPLREHPAWRKGGPEGPIASPEDIRAVLERPTGLRIRTQHAKDGPSPRFVGFDDFMVWPASAAAERQQRLDDKELASVAWGRGLEVESEETQDRASHQGLRPFREGAGVYLPAYEGRRGVLTVHPPEPDKPAIITFRPGIDVPEGCKLQISGRGSFEEPGVRVRVMQDGRELYVFYLSRGWHRQDIGLAPAPADKAVYQIEVWPDGWNMEDAYFDDISLLLPNGSRKFAAAPPAKALPRFPSDLSELDGAWLWNAQGLRTALLLKDGKPSRLKWKFRLDGRRLISFIGDERSADNAYDRAVELRQGSNGNWDGVIYPQRSSVRFERLDINRPGQQGPPRSPGDLNGNWIWDYGSGTHIIEFKRGKAQGVYTSWKFRLEDGILSAEPYKGRISQLVPQEDGSWLGYEPQTGYVIKVYRAK